MMKALNDWNSKKANQSGIIITASIMFEFYASLIDGFMTC